MATAPRTPGANRLRRSMHFVPGANRRMLDKALASAADSLILDLEDAVTPERKDSARRTVAEWLATVNFGRQERCVRLNPLDSPWGEDDLWVTMAHPPDAYVVPKVSSRGELDRIDALLGDLEAEHGHPPGRVGLVLVATETPRAVLNLPELPACPRVIAMTWGAEDLSAALGGSRNRDASGVLLDVYRHCRVQTLLAAAAAGVQPLDSVFVDIRDDEGLRRECEEASWMGYTGKITIHPAQIDTVNAAFSPSAEAIDEARRLVAAFAEAEAEGRMAFAFEGKMVDVPHLRRAEGILERARRMEAAEG